MLKPAVQGNNFAPDPTQSHLERTLDQVMAVGMKFDPLEHLTPIEPKVLAIKTGLPLATVLTELFHATVNGTCDMIFSMECQRCGASVRPHQHLQDFVRNQEVCGQCRYVNEPEHLLDNVKVTFNHDNRILYWPKKNFDCPHAPVCARMQHFLFWLLAMPSDSTYWCYTFDKKNQNDMIIIMMTITITTTITDPIPA